MADKRPFPSFMIFRDKEGNWRWNFAGPGGRILATSSQAYSRGAGCVRAIQLLKGSGDVPVVGRAEDLKAAREGAAGRAAADGTEQVAEIEEASAAPAGRARSGGKKAEAPPKAAAETAKSDKKSR